MSAFAKPLSKQWFFRFLGFLWDSWPPPLHPRVPQETQKPKKQGFDSGFAKRRPKTLKKTLF